MSRGLASGGRGDPVITAGPKLLSVARVVTSRTRGRVQKRGNGLQIFLLASANPASRPLSDCVGRTSHVTGRPRRAALKILREKWSQRTVCPSAGSLEDQAEFLGPDAAGAHAPPVDKEAPGERDRDLFAATLVGITQFFARPEDGPIVRLELEQAPRRFDTPEAQPGTAMFVNRAQLPAIASGVLRWRQTNEATRFLARLEPTPIEHLTIQGPGRQRAEADRRGWSLGHNLRLDGIELFLDRRGRLGRAREQTGQRRWQVRQQLWQHAGPPPLLGQPVTEGQGAAFCRTQELMPGLGERFAFTGRQPVQFLLRGRNAHRNQQPGPAGAVIGQIERELPRIAFVVFAPPAITLQIAGAHHDALRAQGDQFARQRETSRPGLVDAAHPETSLEQLRHPPYQSVFRHALRRLWPLARDESRHHLPGVGRIDAEEDLLL